MPRTIEKQLANRAVALGCGGEGAALPACCPARRQPSANAVKCPRLTHSKFA